MNPFELPGPQFLAFYVLLGLATLALLFQLKQMGGEGTHGRTPISDPYVIAYLRGGAIETVQLGIAVLVDRKLLVIGGGDTVFRREGVSPVHGANELERAILDACSEAAHPRDLLGSSRLQHVATRTFEPGLQRLGLLASPEVRVRRFRQATFAVIVLVGVAAVKVVIGLARNRPVLFLLLAGVLFSSVAFVMMRGERTVRGDRMLSDLRVLFDGLKNRARDLQPYTSTNELALLMAVFGLGAVPVMAFPFGRAIRPPQEETSTSWGSSSSCGSSSSSSCGGGGSSCGGGGGCGGCGGS